MAKKNTDPTAKAELDPMQYQAAIKEGFIPVQMVCTDPEDETAILSFSAFVHALPRIGERIALENDQDCEVRDVMHKVTKYGPTKFYTFVANIHAVLLPEGE